jgi:hypothetical protein
VGLGEPSSKSNSRRSNGCGGGTTNACTPNSATAPPPKSRPRITLASKPPRRQPPPSKTNRNQTQDESGNCLSVCEGVVVIRRRLASAGLLVCCLFVAIGLDGCTAASGVPAPVSKLLAERSVSHSAKLVCPSMGNRTPILAAASSTVRQLRALTLNSGDKARMDFLTKGQAGSTYIAICIFSTKHLISFSPTGQRIAWWREKDGSDGIIAIW